MDWGGCPSSSSLSEEASTTVVRLRRFAGGGISAVAASVGAVVHSLRHEPKLGTKRTEQQIRRWECKKTWRLVLHAYGGRGQLETVSKLILRTKHCTGTVPLFHVDGSPDLGSGLSSLFGYA